MDVTTSHRTNGDEEARVAYKSWKKKYRKLRHTFEGVMKRSDELFKQDLIATAAIKRITEENNRLLDLLLDLDTNPHISKKKRKHRIFIGSPSSASPKRFLSADDLEEFNQREFYTEEIDPDSLIDEPEDVQAEPEMEPEMEPEAKMDVDTEPMELDTEQPDREMEEEATKPNGDSKEDIDKDDNETMNVEETANEKPEEEAAQKPPTKPKPKTKPKPRIIRRAISPPKEPVYVRGQTPERFRETSPFLNPIEDEELPPGTIVHYHHDSTTTVPPSTTSPTTSKFPGGGTTSSGTTAAPDEEHHWPRNPMSVYCWLRKYQPQVFLQDSEVGGERKKRNRKNAHHDEDDEPVAPEPVVVAATTATSTGGTKARRAGGAKQSISSATAAGDLGDGKSTAKRKRKQREDADDTEREKEKEKPGKKSGGVIKRPAAKRPRKSLASAGITVVKDENSL